MTISFLFLLFAYLRHDNRPCMWKKRKVLSQILWNFDFPEFTDNLNMWGSLARMFMTYLEIKIEQLISLP